MAEMDRFEFTSHPARVIFGRGSIERLPEELQRLQSKRPFILCKSRQKNEAAQTRAIIESAGISPAGTFEGATVHTPRYITEEATDQVRASGADSLVSFGGGSSVGLGKAISLRTGLKHICIPTTYAGSEMTPILGETDNGVKLTTTNPAVLPAIVIYDADLTMALSRAVTVASGLNAFAHAVEALYAWNSNPVIHLLAEEGIRALAESLPILAHEVGDERARERAQYGAWLCGICLGSVGMSLHHKLCHVLGGSLNLSHAETHAAVLPHAVAYNAPSIPHALDRLARALPGSNNNAIASLNALLDTLDVGLDLKSLGMREQDIQRVVELTLSESYWNPRPLEKEPLYETVRRCWAGEAARADL